MTQPVDVESPCTRICALDPSTGYCTGCFRTLHEISYWVSYTPQERLRIMAFVETRRVAHAGPKSKH